MQFQVPQFIEVEDKIFGPLTFKQFIYLLGGAGASYMFWRLLPIFISLPLIAGVMGLAVSLAFLQINGRPFITAVESAFYYLLGTKLYLWNNTRKTPAKHETPIASDRAKAYVPKLSDSKLHELAWSLDIKERIAAGTMTDEERERSRTQTGAVAAIRTARDAVAAAK